MRCSARSLIEASRPISTSSSVAFALNSVAFALNSVASALNSASSTSLPASIAFSVPMSSGRAEALLVMATTQAHLARLRDLLCAA